jgi:hypothetical protein
MVECPWCGKEVSAEEYGKHYETCPRRKGVTIHTEEYPRSPLGWIKFLNGSVHLYISAEYLDTDNDIPIERAKVLFRDYINDLEKAIQMFKEGLHRLGES